MFFTIHNWGIAPVMEPPCAAVFPTSHVIPAAVDEKTGTEMRVDFPEADQSCGWDSEDD